MTTREKIAKLNREIRAIGEAPCATCGHPYWDHLQNLRCYGLRCKCKAFIDRESTGQGENGCAR